MYCKVQWCFFPMTLLKMSTPAMTCLTLQSTLFSSTQVQQFQVMVAWLHQLCACFFFLFFLFSVFIDESETNFKEASCNCKDAVFYHQAWYISCIPISFFFEIGRALSPLLSTHVIWSASCQSSPIFICHSPVFSLFLLSQGALLHHC